VGRDGVSFEGDGHGGFQCGAGCAGVSAS
jgi:hypothetical protein